ncbi:sensor histidine kinase [Streptomyces sp. 4R-3d]|uniref:sensor histidine kinase n=1 Tax=Streptomyces sp. 4R-3d TaxID=2559605 RepID=UPI001071E393|nr:sensor histidine kinase [Streptomyces sp. 4R-3d]TFI31504.1 sensor histidine kinase [Streptomyces sp. 4R-3d]
MGGESKGSAAGRRAWLLDTALAALTCGVVLLAAMAARNPGPDALDVALIAAGTLALAAHRRAPVAVLVVTTLCMLAYVLHGQPGSWAAFPVLAAVHASARSGRRSLGIVASAVFLVVFFAVDPGADDIVERTALLVGWFLSAGVTGLVDKNWQAYLRQTEERAREAERTREEAALRRAGEERLRIARELHDSLTHSISIVKLQAGVAVHLARKRGDEVPAALLAIQEASGEAMRELRSTLEVLRTDVVPEGTGLDRLDELVERARTAGIAVAVSVTHTDKAPGPLPEAVDRTAYRIVQEALTNVARHADRAKTEIRLTHRARHLLVEVEDDGPAAPGDPVAEGTGLTGMRERVAVLGGRLHAAPGAGGGFTVRAELPLEGA